MKVSIGYSFSKNLRTSSILLSNHQCWDLAMLLSHNPCYLIGCFPTYFNICGLAFRHTMNLDRLGNTVILERLKFTARLGSKM